MARLDKEKQTKLEPERVNYALSKLKELGKEIIYQDSTSIKFIHKSETVTFYPFSGWHTGKTIKDGRGINNLLNQIKT